MDCARSGPSLASPPDRTGRRGPAAFVRAFAVAWALAAVTAVRAEPMDEGLRAQLEDLAAREGLTVRGLERVAEASARELAGETLEDRIKWLLIGFNYMLLHDSEGNIAELRILGGQAADPTGPRRFTVATTRRDSHHLVDALLVGPTGAWRQRTLILDTGASTIVLPASMIASLGFRSADLADGWAETAGGRVEAKVARLESVTVGQAVARDVEVTFIEDKQIGGKALLGMSFLDRFQLSIDDASGYITLTAK